MDLFCSPCMFGQSVTSYISSHDLQHQQYADDLQVYTVLRPGAFDIMQCMSLCVQDVSRWFMDNSLLLNPSRTEAMVFGTRQRLSTLELPHDIDICGITIAFGDAVKLRGVTLDSTLSLDRHVTNIVRSCNYYIRALRHIRSALSHA